MTFEEFYTYRGISALDRIWLFIPDDTRLKFRGSHKFGVNMEFKYSSRELLKFNLPPEKLEEYR